MMIILESSSTDNVEERRMEQKSNNGGRGRKGIKELLQLKKNQRLYSLRKTVFLPFSLTNMKFKKNN